MAYHYSPGERGFFHTSVHGNAMPRDAVGITDAEYAELMRRQSEGMVIEPVAGRPQAVRNEAPPVEPRAHAMSALEFRSRFTPEEKARLTLAASNALDAGDATLQVFIDDLNSSGSVHLNDERIVAGGEYLIGRGLLTPRRGDTILGR